ncbi:HlyD family efflux transporter periplasmic adaptor subunit [candidate division KSB1 bacterium]|nr:HlyD family efflux transporter periplasmic adaptor subunit [candidate division KSB1 bacterium]
MDRVLEKKKWPPKKIVLLSFSGLFVIFIFYTIFFSDKSSKLNVQTERITVSTVEKKAFQEFIPVIGTVIPIQTIYLDAIEGGRVEEIFNEAGSFVKTGDKILKLGNTNLLLDIMYREAELFAQSNNLRNTRLAMEQQRLSIRAQLIELNYQLANTKRAYQRAKELHQKGLVSEEEYEKLKNEYEYLGQKTNITLESHKQDSLFRDTQIHQLEASLSRMQANLEIVKTNLENLTIKAPITGQLTSLVAEIGESKSRGQRLGQIDVLEGFKVRVGIDEHYIARIDLNQNGEFTFDNQDYRLYIKKIYPEVKEGKFEVDMLFDGNAPAGIRRGQTVHVRLELGNLTEATLLARGGFYQKTGGQWVFVVDKSESFAAKRQISIGRQNPEFFEVLSGLEPGEKVITSSYDNFGDVDKLILK